jgi:hypothetical protein
VPHPLKASGSCQQTERSLQRQGRKSAHLEQLKASQQGPWLAAGGQGAAGEANGGLLDAAVQCALPLLTAAMQRI